MIERYKIHWIDVRAFKDDDNEGYVYGICEQDEEGQIHDIEWYKTEEERDRKFMEGDEEE